MGDAKLAIVGWATESKVHANWSSPPAEGYRIAPAIAATSALVQCPPYGIKIY